jgi:hypothetical protein
MKTRRTPIILLVLFFFSYCSCEKEKSLEDIFDHSSIPGRYIESYAHISCLVDDRIETEYIPLQSENPHCQLKFYDTSEVIQTGEKSYRIYFGHKDPRLPKEITVEIIDYVSRNFSGGYKSFPPAPQGVKDENLDPMSGKYFGGPNYCRAILDVTVDSKFQPIAAEDGTRSGTSCFTECVFFESDMSYYIALSKASTDEKIYLVGSKK